MAAIAGLAVAAVTAIVLVYEPRPLFHSLADYWLLFTAALGSGAGTTARTLLSYWRVPSETSRAAIQTVSPD